MERLTTKELFGNREMICRFEDCHTTEEYCPHINTGECNCLQKALNKLGEYEDLEEKGLLVQLPCAVGDTIYKLWYTECHIGETYPDSYSCSGCEDECDMKREISEFVVPSIQWIVKTMDNFNKTVYFLTREQAEQALKDKETNYG